ncbi:MAG: type II toxin-antitoxin system RelE family toxin [Thermoplasmatota archaeon]
MSYQILIEEKAVTEIKSLNKKTRERIKKKIREILADDPLPGGKGDIKKIIDSDFDHWRLRVGDYRVFYDIDSNDKIVYIISVRHRSKAYRDL